MQLNRVLAISLLLAGCEEDAAPEEQDSGATECADDEVVLAYLGTQDDRDECVTIPDACGDVAQCAVDECISALYGLCEAPTIGAGCSDAGMNTIVSCNE